jgi:hydrogenase maturation protease
VELMTSDDVTSTEDSSGPPGVLVAGIGNIFMGDDAFGCEVARRLVGRQLPEGVRVVDFGIRGFDLAYAIMDGPDVTVFVDATPRGGEPGTLYTIEPDLNDLDDAGAGGIMIDAHSMNPLKVLGMVKAMGGEFKRILLVGCEPLTLGGEEGLMGLSGPVEAAVDEAVGVVESLVVKILEESRAQAVSSGKH